MRVTIATDEQICQAADGKIFTLSILVGQPFQEKDGVWACAVLLQGLDNKERVTRGEHSLQALGLALAFVRAELSSFADGGGSLFDPETNQAFSVAEYIKNIFNRSAST